MLRTLFLLALVGTGLTQDGHGILGLGLVRYNPLCAAACTEAIQKTRLSCSLNGSVYISHATFPNTLPSCFASDEPYLTTLAWCIQQHCPDQDDPARIEHFWKTKITMNANKPPFPKWTYQQALVHIQDPPTVVVAPQASLNETSIIDEAAWEIHRDTYAMDVVYENKTSIYSLVVVVTVLVIPLALTVLRKVLPKPTSSAAKVQSVLVTPALWGRNLRAPVCGGLGLQPSRGIAILISYILVINLLLSLVDYPNTSRPNMRYKDENDQITMGIGLRTGLLSFSNMALVIFLGGRNTFLLWLTDWSRATYLLIHRWIAYVSIIQGAIHCLVYLDHYVVDGMYYMHVVMPFFIWGTVAMFAMVFLWAFSFLPIRRRHYEAFLTGHIVFAILTLVGCWYHVWHLYGNLWGFEVWLYVCFAAWIADRLFRVIRMAKWGVKQAAITRIDHDYIRLDIERVAIEGHAFLYFPSLSWRFWESHPFSVASSICHAPFSQSPSQAPKSLDGQSDTEKQVAKVSTEIPTSPPPPGSAPPFNTLTFFCRVGKGTTLKLASRAGTAVPVLIEGGYEKISVGADYPQLIAIVGGAGISTALSVLRKHPGQARLYWGVRSAVLVDHIRARGLLDGVEVAQISVGRRLDIPAILDMEIDGRVKHLAVLSSGPQSMADDVRAATVEVMRRTGVNVKLLDESFSW